MNLACAERLYNEATNETALAPKARYNFASQLARKSGRWLDLGTNRGLGIQDLPQKPNYLLDICHPFLAEQVGQRIQANAANLPFPSKSMDTITVMELIEHVSFTTALELLKETKRVLTDKGTAIISTPNRGAYGKRMSSPDHVREYSQEELKNMVDSAGFRIVDTLGQGFLKEGNLLTNIIRTARDNRIVSWLYYHGPLFVRNHFRIGLQKTTASEEIRQPKTNETIKNFVLVLKPNR